MKPSSHRNAGNLRELVEKNRQTGKPFPVHVAMIMDGNGRWAEQRHLPRVEGHRAGIRAVRKIVEEAAQLKIKTLSLYVFSMENWNRPPQEISQLMSYLKTYLKREQPMLIKNNIRLKGVGKLDLLPPEVRTTLQKTEQATAGNSGMILALALSYGGRTDLIEACRSIASQAAAGKLSPDRISGETIEAHLSTAELPPVDLLIRTSGEKRISNFLLWESAYAELYFTPVLWPDFKPIDLWKALLDYQGRQRRFGAVGETAFPAGEDK